MSDPYIQELFAERIGGNQYGKSTAIYKFEKIKRAKKAAKEANPNVDLIDMGVGEPDEMAFPIVIQSLQDEAAKPENRGYADNGGEDFKEAAAKYMEEVFGVCDIDSRTEVIHSIGSKTALSMVPACFINPGDYVLMTIPGYPVLGTHAQYLGGHVYNIKLEEDRDFLPDLDAVPDEIVAKAKILVLNYPNNPTGASATLDFFAKAVAFAKANNLIILQDAAYASLIFEGKPVSIFQVPGAKDVAVELHSLSKSYNMTGWRIGFVVGNSLIVQAYADMKDNSDSGQFLAIQKAGAVALANPQITNKIAEKYSRRMDILISALTQNGFSVKKPKGSFFLYVTAPKSATFDGTSTQFDSGEAFSQWLITNELISTVPWDDCGNFVRFSVTFDAKGEEKEKEIVHEISQRLAKYEFTF
ncbi:MAG: LL-diaminopimelate aminotransferase [Verrucomicrobiota bacterium]|nr:LL-diaminopimelate aminotransferase [Verrucomicrobiota bacterium]MEE2988256.1 LL-diaminopimelate aminotransferase [Verrucomicrobiota bacterium]